MYTELKMFQESVIRMVKVYHLPMQNNSKLYPFFKCYKSSFSEGLSKTNDFCSMKNNHLKEC